jgi:NAD(P)-dependent dehydrogenase (short-subunit alcohol dehydrogenase family)
MSQVAALEYARNNIRLNAIFSGLLANQLTSGNGQSSTNAIFIPMNRGGSPQEIAQTVVWLCSKQASYITGLLYL